MRGILIGLAMLAPSAAPVAGPVPLDFRSMRRVATIDERYQSYNVEMAEVIGGNFWKAYDPNAKPAPPPAYILVNSVIYARDCIAPARRLVPGDRPSEACRRADHGNGRLLA